MTSASDGVLIPVDVSEPVASGTALVDILDANRVVMLGYWPIPDQAVADQVRDQFGTEAEKRLRTLTDRYFDAGTDLETRVVFTKDRDRLIDTAANEYGCQSVLVPGSGSRETALKRGIVLVKPDADLDRLTATVVELFADTGIELCLFHVTRSENEHLYDATRYMLRGLADRLEELGIDRNRIGWEQSTAGDRYEAILSRVAGFDFVVSSETKPGLRERVFGSVQSMLVDETEKPLLIVRRER